MSYSFLEPEWPAVCECKYDEARDEMDREDCYLHCDWEGDTTDVAAGTRRKLTRQADADITESAA